MRDTSDFLFRTYTNVIFWQKSLSSYADTNSMWHESLFGESFVQRAEQQRHYEHREKRSNEPARQLGQRRVKHCFDQHVESEEHNAHQNKADCSAQALGGQPNLESILNTAPVSASTSHFEPKGLSLWLTRSPTCFDIPPTPAQDDRGERAFPETRRAEAGTCCCSRRHACR